MFSLRILEPVLGTAIGVLLLLLPGPCVADDPIARQAVIDYINGLRSLSARFEQRRHDETGGLLEVAQGECRIERPGRFRWQYEDPYPQLIVSDGARLWIYDEDLEQVTVNAFEGTASDSPAALLASDADVASHYVVSALDEDEAGRQWWRFEPREGSRVQGVELGFVDGEVSAMRLSDQLGQTTALVFDDIERNQPIAAGTFNFEPPPGVDVLQGGAP